VTDLLALGVSHKTAPLELRERVARTREHKKMPEAKPKARYSGGSGAAGRSYSSGSGAAAKNCSGGSGAAARNLFGRERSSREELL
jgi:hypothetical protein